MFLHCHMRIFLLKILTILTLVGFFFLYQVFFLFLLLLYCNAGNPIEDEHLLQVHFSLYYLFANLQDILKPCRTIFPLTGKQLSEMWNILS